MRVSREGGNVKRGRGEIVQTLDNLFERMTEFDRLELAYRNARKGKRYRDEVLRFGNNLDDNLLSIQREVREGTFRFGPYRKHWVYVPKKRVIMALPFRSRIVQWTVYQELNPFYDRQMIEDSYACRDGKGALAAALRLQYWMRQAESKPGNWYTIKLDISKFFYRIDHKTLADILRRRIKDERLMALLEQIINANGERFGLPRYASPEDIEAEDWLTDVGMPIGNLTSQLFANIYLNELDQYCKHILKIKCYVRYMDDVVIVAPSKEAAQRWKEEIETFLYEHLKLDLNKKTAIRPMGKVEFVGFIISTHELKLRKSTVRRMKRAVHAICDKLFTGEMTQEAFDRRVASYNGMLTHCEVYNLCNRLNDIYTAKAEKYHITLDENQKLPFAA